MHLREFLNFVREMYDENYAERWEAGMKPFSNEWEYLTKHQTWLEKEFYHKEARDWREGTIWGVNKDTKSVSELLQDDLEPIDNMVDEGGPVWTDKDMDYSGAFESDVSND